MIPDQQPKYFASDSSRDGLPAAFNTSQQKAACTRLKTPTDHMTQICSSKQGPQTPLKGGHQQKYAAGL